MRSMRDIEAEDAAARRHRRIGEFMDSLARGQGKGRLEGGDLISFRIRFSTEDEPSTLLIVRCVAAEGPRIAFVGAYQVGDALLAWRARSVSKTMRWREDVPWGERG